jgi:hypothetical protein
MNHSTPQGGEPRADGSPAALWRFLLGPIGALLTGICFFLPWGRCSWLGIERRASGAETGGWPWIIPACAGIVIVATIAGRLLRRMKLARALSFGAALLGLLFLLEQTVEVSRGLHTPLGRLRPDQLGVRPAFGFFGTVLGLIVALAGAIILRPASRAEVDRLASRPTADLPTGRSETDVSSAPERRKAGPA